MKENKKYYTDQMWINGKWVTPEEALTCLDKEPDWLLFHIYQEAIGGDFRTVPNSIKHCVVQIGNMLKDRIDNHNEQLLANLFDE